MKNSNIYTLGLIYLAIVIIASLIPFTNSKHHTRARSFSEKLMDQFSPHLQHKIERKTQRMNKSIEKLQKLERKMAVPENVKLANSLKHHKEIIARLEKDTHHNDRYLEGKFYGMPLYSEDLAFLPNEIKKSFKKQNKNFSRKLIEKKVKVKENKEGISLVNNGNQAGRRLVEQEKTDDFGDTGMFQKRFGDIDENYKGEVNKVLENIHSSITNMNEEKHIMKGMMENQLDRKLDFLYYDFVRISHRIDETQAYLVTLMNNIDKHYDDKQFEDTLEINGKSSEMQKEGANFKA